MPSQKDKSSSITAQYVFATSTTFSCQTVVTTTFVGSVLDNKQRRLNMMISMLYSVLTVMLVTSASKTLTSMKITRSNTILTHLLNSWMILTTKKIKIL